MGAKIALSAAPQQSQSTVPQGAIGAVLPMAPVNLQQVFPEVGGSMESIRQEVDDAFADMKTFMTREPDEIMRICSGHSARLSEIRVRIQRIEDFHRQWKPVRVREVEPTLDELERQFTIASRLQSVRELDYRMERGMP